MKDIFKQGAIDLIILLLIIGVLFTPFPIFSISWIINIIYLVCLTIWFICDISILGDKIEKYIDKKKENKKL